MTHSRRGSDRPEISDLRNIVDRLDLLMDATTAGRSRTPRDQLLAQLAERVDSLEDEVEELRTLVNHLMTIATWQAKVTATLVGDELDEQDDEDGDPERPGATGPAPIDAGRAQAAPSRSAAPRPPQRSHDADPRDDRRRAADEHRAPGGRYHADPRTLDDDIDEILGTDRPRSRQDRPRSRQDTGPPDFGI